MAPNVRLPARTLVIVGDTSPALGSRGGGARRGARLAGRSANRAATRGRGAERDLDRCVCCSRSRPSSTRRVPSTSSWSVDPPCRELCCRCCATRDRRCRSSQRPRAGPTRRARLRRCSPRCRRPTATTSRTRSGWRCGRTPRRAARAAHRRCARRTTSAAELGLARSLYAALPADALLFLGSSMPVRDVFAAAAPREGVTVLANRGAAGIDGTVSSRSAQRWPGSATAEVVPSRSWVTSRRCTTRTAWCSGRTSRHRTSRSSSSTTTVVRSSACSSRALRTTPTPSSGSSGRRTASTSPHGAARRRHRTRGPASVGAALDAALDPRGGGIQVVELRTDRAAVARVRRDLRGAVQAAVVVHPRRQRG